MAISVTNLIKQNGVWSYEYQFDTSNNQLVNDDFFNDVKFVEYLLTDTTIKTWLFNYCNAFDFPFIQAVQDVIHCPQNVSFSVSDAYKFAQHSYRTVSSDFTWICTNIYRDIMKLSISMKGMSFNCEIGDTDETSLLCNGIAFILSVLGDDYSAFFDEILQGKYYFTRQPHMDVGIINSVFSNISSQYEVNIIPKNHKKAIDNNVVNDINCECTLDGKMLMGRITAQIKNIVPLNRMGGD